MNNTNDFPVDAVITWVDGNDTDWQKKINTYKETKIDFSKKRESVRYNSIGEIDIALKSIIKYADFVRNIYLVTDNQKPDTFEKLKKSAAKNNIALKVIDHTIIFKDFESYLPSFNSASICSLLFRIPHLSEHFIVFNDDTFLMRKTTISDFFKNGNPVIRGKWQQFDENRTLRKMYHSFLKLIGKPKKKKGVSFKKFQQKSAKLAGTKKYLRRFHTPVSMRKSTLVNFFKGNNLLEENIKHRFRNENQFIISSLSENLEIKNKTYHLEKRNQLTYFRSYKNHSIVKLKLSNFLTNENKLFMTFQSLEKATPKTLKYILNWIENRISTIN